MNSIKNFLLKQKPQLAVVVHKRQDFFKRNTNNVSVEPPKLNPLKRLIAFNPLKRLSTFTTVMVVTDPL